MKIKPTWRVLLVLTGLCAALALLLPWWQMTMHAPQYPDGLHVSVGLFSVNGDVAEIDDLNHYIGFRPLETVALIERQVAWLAIPAALLPFLALGLRAKKFAWLAAIPTATIAPFFAVDLATWMWYSGNHLDPHAALSDSITPWTPHFIGPGGVGQFHTFAMFYPGFFFGAAATVLTVVMAVRALRPQVGAT